MDKGGGGQSGPPGISALRHMASEELVLNMTTVGLPLRIFFEIYNFSVAQTLTILERQCVFAENLRKSGQFSKIFIF